MKRFWIILFAILLFGICPALAEKTVQETTEDTIDETIFETPAGTWYGEVEGFILTLSLQEDGTYAFSVPGGEEARGAWVAEGGTVILDGETAFDFIGGTLLSRNGDLSFFRQQPDIYVPAPVTDMQFIEAEGIRVPLDLGRAWRSAYVLIDGTAVPADAFGDSVALYFESLRAVIVGDLFGEMVVDFVFEDNALRMEEEGLAFLIQRQEDGYLRFTVTAGGEELVYILEPYLTEEFPLGTETDEEIPFAMPENPE